MCTARAVALALSSLAAGSSLAAADTRVNVASISADGLEVRRLSCSLTSGGLFGSVMVIGTLAKSKKALDACAPGGAAFSVAFTWKGGKTTGVRVTESSLPRQNDCVARALTQVKSGVAGSCTAILLAGRAEVAGKAADGLSKKGDGGDPAEGADAR